MMMSGNWRWLPIIVMIACAPAHAEEVQDEKETAFGKLNAAERAQLRLAGVMDEEGNPIPSSGSARSSAAKRPSIPPAPIPEEAPASADLPMAESELTLEPAPPLQEPSPLLVPAAAPLGAVEETSPQ